jgi:OmcA/MtrC family decaheme c-type cytochrome
MRKAISVRGVTRFSLALLVVAGSIMLSSTPKKGGFTPRDKAFYADASTVNFVRPGLSIQIVSAKIAADGTISVDYMITDPNNQPLDPAGIQTPGAVAVSFLAAYIPKGQTQYVSYATRARSSADGKTTVTQAAADSGGTSQLVTAGEYIYTFKTQAPKGFDPTATHRIGIYGSRNLTEFDLGTFYDDATFDFVPAGGKPAPREVIKTVSCNKCHDQLAHHGGSRRSLDLCIMCHTPQTSEPNTGNTVDMKVMAHKIHMGSLLPSVIAGTPYQIGGPPNPSDWSTVTFPSDPRRCESCHEPSTGAAQAGAWLTNPSRAACGACHDDVNFATGLNHVNQPQVDDTQCTNCHIPQGELEFDASIRGAHTLPQESATRPGIVVQILKVVNGGAGQKPTVTFTMKDYAGNGIQLSAMTASPNRVSLNMAGPTSDYGYTSFGSDVTTPGYDAENPTTTGTCSPDGTCSYTFTHAIPAGAKGTYAIGIEARRGLTLLAGTTLQQSTQYGADNKVFYFSVDGTPVVARRQVVDIAKCNACHTRLSEHGESRNQTVYCVLCHNPSNTDAAKPGQSINFSLFVHKIHSGTNLQALGATYVVSGKDFSTVRYPVMSNTGTTGDTAKCYMCHVNNSEAVFPIGLNPVKNPQGLLDPTPATTAACTACHVAKSAMAHAQSQTDPKLGESCDVCHDINGEFSVIKEHAGK